MLAWWLDVVWGWLLGVAVCVCPGVLLWCASVVWESFLLLCCGVYVVVRMMVYFPVMLDVCLSDCHIAHRSSFYTCVT